MGDNRFNTSRLAQACGVLMASLLIAAGPASAGSTLWRLKVNGMVCSFCAQGVKRKLSEIPGVRSITVDMPTHTISLVTADGFKGGESSIRKAVQDAGYAMTSIQQSGTAP
jgi:mercuric ion binding protein